MTSTSNDGNEAPKASPANMKAFFYNSNGELYLLFESEQTRGEFYNSLIEKMDRTELDKLLIGVSKQGPYIGIPPGTLRDPLIVNLHALSGV